MVLALILIVLATATLYLMGMISWIAALALELMACVSLVMMLGVRMTHRSRLYARSKTLRAKWCGALTLVFGLPALIEQTYYLFISRRDELIVEHDPSQWRLPLSSVEAILIVNAGVLLHMSDADLASRMKASTPTGFQLTRGWIRRHPQFASKRMLIVWPHREAVATLQTGEALVFCDDRGLGDISALLRRPEVALKTTVIDAPTPKGGDDRAPNIDGHNADTGTQPFVVQRVRQVLARTPKTTSVSSDDDGQDTSS